jgi:hypothetical protein
MLQIPRLAVWCIAAVQKILERLELFQILFKLMHGQKGLGVLKSIHSHEIPAATYEGRHKGPRS